MKKRQHELLEMLKNANNWVNGTEIAHFFQVTPRTIRSDINKINAKFSFDVILSHSHFGYYFDTQRLGQLSTSNQSEQIPETPSQRTKYLLKELLFSKQSINLVYLQDTLCTSLATLDKDVHRIRMLLNSYTTLSIERKGDTIILRGDEFEKRKLCKELLSKEVTDNFLNMNKLAMHYTSFDFIEISDMLQHQLEQYDYPIRKTYISIVMVHIAIAIDRILQGKYIKNIEINRTIEQTKEYNIASDFYHQVEQVLHTTIPDKEVYLLAILLLGKQSSIYQKENQSIHKHPISIEDTVIGIIQKVDKVFDINLLEDEELKSGLTTHLQSYAARLKNKEDVKNIFLPEIKKQYPLVFEMGIMAASIIEKRWNIMVSEDEIGFLSIHLGSAYNRFSKNKKIRGVLIYPHEASFSHICKTKIDASFFQQLEIVETFYLFDEHKILKYNPDLILTTIPIEHSLSIPTLQISLFLTSSDESRIFQWLSTIQKRSSYLALTSKLEEVIRPDFFYIDMDACCVNGVIGQMSKELTLKNMVPLGFYEDVLKREDSFPTSFSYGFATPHAMTLTAKESVIAVASLKKPIAWGGFQVQVVFLLALKDDEQDVLRFFFEWLSRAMDNKKIMHQLLHMKNYQSFMNEVFHFEETQYEK